MKSTGSSGTPSCRRWHSRNPTHPPCRCRIGRLSCLQLRRQHALQPARCIHSMGHRTSSTRMNRPLPCWLHRSCRPLHRCSLRFRIRHTRHHRPHRSSKRRRSRTLLLGRRSPLRPWCPRCSYTLLHPSNLPPRIRHRRRRRLHRSSSCRHNRNLILGRCSPPSR